MIGIKRALLLLPLLLVMAVAACDSVEERVQKHYERGLELVEANAIEKAKLEFRNALKLNRDHAPSHFELGKIAEASGNAQQAFVRYRFVVEQQPDNVGARIKTSRFFILANKLDEAEAEILETLKRAPDQAEVHALHAAVLLKQNRLDEARAALDRAFTIAPGDVDAALIEISYLYQTGDADAALDRADETIAAYPAKATVYLLKLQILEALQNQPAVGAHLEVMADAFPKQVKFREALARWAVREGRLEFAEAQYRRIIDLSPDNSAHVLQLIGFLQEHQGDDVARDELVARIDSQADPFRLQLLLAQFDLRQGKVDESATYLRDLIGTSGENANLARIALARLEIARGNGDVADQLVADALSTDQNDVEAMVLQVARLVDRGEIEQSIKTVRDALEEAPEDIRLLQLAGRAQELGGNLDLANDRLASAVRAAGYTPESVSRYVKFLVRSVRFTAAETVLGEAIRRNPGNAELLDLLGFTRLRLENWLGAEEAARALDTLSPDRARQLRAAILIGQERFEEGADLLRQLPADGRQRAASVATLVQTFVREGKLDEAVAFLEDLLTENPENLQAIGIRGNLYLADGKLAEAEVQFKRILEIDPGNGGAHSALARLYSSRGDEEAAENFLLAGLDLSPDNLILLARLAQYREGQGRFDDAIDVYEQLYDRVPDSLLVANNLSSLLADHRADDPAALERAYTIASRLRPSDLPHYRDTYGWTRHLKGEHKIAHERIGPVVEALPTNPWVQYHFGMVLVALGKSEEARGHLEEALRLVEGAEDRFPPTETVRATLASMVGQ